MSHRVCSRCGAPLPASAAAFQRCEFCGVENERDAPPNVPAQAPPRMAPNPYAPMVPFAPRFVPSPTSPASSAAPVIAMMALAGLVAAGGAAFALMARQDSSMSVMVTPPAIAVPAIPVIPTIPTDPAPVPVADLHTTPLSWMTQVKIDAPGRVGTLDSFDALANWDWAQSIGMAWWSDAKPYGLTVDPIEKDGTIDLTGPFAGSVAPSVDWHFVSQACLADQKKRAETEANNTGSSCSLSLHITGKDVQVGLDLSSVDEGGRAHPITRPACSIADVFTYLDAHKLTARPNYQVRLVNDVFGFEYRVSSGHGSASMDGTDLAPGFCGKKAPPKPAATATTSAATGAATTGASGASSAGSNGAPLPPFDRVAALAAIRGANPASCGGAGDSPDQARATIIFAPSGDVSAVTVGPPLSGTPAGACAANKFRQLQVPPFSGGTVSVSSAF
ncbi:hypothetical protein BH09MYX1_BH09MYX1_03000 [soil metagenome]